VAFSEKTKRELSAYPNSSARRSRATNRSRAERMERACPERPGFPARNMESPTAFATPGGLGREVAALSRYMYGTDRGRSGLQRDDENDALAERVPFLQPVPIRETIDRDPVDTRDLVKSVPLVHLVARGPLPDVRRRAGGG